MRLKCLACEVLARPVYQSAAQSSQIVDVTLLPFGLHVTPNQLHEALQAAIASADAQDPVDAVVLAYGLCGKATHGLRAGRVPLVLPRAHDCITLFLGGRARYNQEFEACPGTYWYVQDFIERGENGDIPLSMGANTAVDTEKLHAEYVAKYGQDNADYLIAVMEDWQAHYERAAYIEIGVGKRDTVANRAQADAERHHWRFERLAGDLVLIKRLLDGDWGDDFLVVQPGEQVEMVGGEGIVQAVQAA